MKDYQKRVVDERDELEKKLLRLRVFLKTDEYKFLDMSEQMLLNGQCRCMSSYLEVLSKRIQLSFDLRRDLKSTVIDEEIKRWDGDCEEKPIESIEERILKHTKDISSIVFYMIVDFDTCLSIANHIWMTRDTKGFEFADVFNFIGKQMETAGINDDNKEVSR